MKVYNIVHICLVSNVNLTFKLIIFLCNITMKSTTITKILATFYFGFVVFPNI